MSRFVTKERAPLIIKHCDEYEKSPYLRWKFPFMHLYLGYRLGNSSRISMEACVRWYLAEKRRALAMDSDSEEPANI